MPRDGSATPAVVLGNDEVTSFDVNNDVLFYTSPDNFNCGLSSVSADGSTSPMGLAVPFGPFQTQQYCGAVQATDAFIFFAYQTAGELVRVPPGGGTADTLATAQDPQASTVDGDRIYTVLGDGSVVSYLFNGGDYKLVANLGTGNPHAIDAAAGVVAWSSEAQQIAYAKVGDQIVTLVTGMGKTSDVALDGGERAFVAIDDVGVHVVPTGGGQPTRIAKNVPDADRLVIDDGSIYWTTDTKLWRVAVPPAER